MQITDAENDSMGISISVHLPSSVSGPLISKTWKMIKDVQLSALVRQ